MVGEVTGQCGASFQQTRTNLLWRKRAARTKGYPAFRSSEPLVAGRAVARSCVCRINIWILLLIVFDCFQKDRTIAVHSIRSALADRAGPMMRGATDYRNHLCWPANASRTITTHRSAVIVPIAHSTTTTIPKPLTSFDLSPRKTEEKVRYKLFVESHALNVL